VATGPVYLNALSGLGCHVITVNDYLASRDKDLMGRVYRFLGLTVGVITNGMDPSERAEAYRCDITYGTNSEFGFDYLRDNMVTELSQRAQRPLNFALVDEVDSILIDEARTYCGMYYDDIQGVGISDNYMDYTSSSNFSQNNIVLTVTGTNLTDYLSQDVAATYTKIGTIRWFDIYYSDLHISTL